MKLRRFSLATFIAILLALVITVPVLAIAQPDSMSIDGAYAYRNCRETGDMLLLIPYTIDYTTNPDENVSEAYLCRLMEEGSALQSVAPYAYYNAGYGQGVVALYFDADDAPEWEGVYTLELLGNPFQDWEGGVPTDTLSSGDFDVWQDNEIEVNQVVIAGRIISLASDLETAWSKDMVTVADDGSEVLTSYASGYFVQVVPYLSEIAPDVFAEGDTIYSTTMEPELPDRDTGTDYADSLVADIIGTPFDFTALATLMLVSRGALTALIYYGLLAFVAVLLARRLRTYKPMMLLSIPFVILGSFIGVPLIVTMLFGLAALGFTAYAIFYKPSTA